MVDRREIKLTPLTIVDLDGTYVNGNTLVIYLKCGLKFLASHGKISVIAKILQAIILRKLGRYSHYDMKSIILAELFPYPEILEKFREEVMKRINPVVRRLLDQKKMEGQRILLATAAPAFYVRRIWDSDYVATDFTPGKAMDECFTIRKAKRVFLWAEDNQCEIDTVITDSFDDMALIYLNLRGTNILVNPSSSDLRAFRQFKPTHLFLINKLGELSEA